MTVVAIDFVPHGGLRQAESMRKASKAELRPASEQALTGQDVRLYTSLTVRMRAVTYSSLLHSACPRSFHSVLQPCCVRSQIYRNISQPVVALCWRTSNSAASTILALFSMELESKPPGTPSQRHNAL